MFLCRKPPPNQEMPTVDAGVSSLVVHRIEPILIEIGPGKDTQFIIKSLPCTKQPVQHIYNVPRNN